MSDIAQMQLPLMRPSLCCRDLRRCRLPCAAGGGGGGGEPDPYIVLRVARQASRPEIRAAYYERIRELHPDVSVEEHDTTAETVAVNLAYAQLTQGVRSRSFNSEDEADSAPSIFDAPEAEATCVFVNPFACNVSPLDWRELQEVVAETDDPEEALRAAGLYFSYDAAVCWVTPSQLAALLEELEAMEATLSYELTGYFVTDCLLRARYANARVTYVRSPRGGIDVQ